MLRHASPESAEKLSYDNLMRRRVQLEVELDSLEKEKHKASQAHLVEVREELDDSREKHEPLMTNYKKEKQRINEIERLRQKREELLFELQEAEIRYELARDAELRYRAIEDDMEEGPGNSSKVVRFWDGEYEAITAGSVAVSQRLMNQVKELNDLRDKLQPRIMMFWKKKARINQIRQFKQKVGEFLSLQKGVKLDELIRAKNLQYHAIKKVEAAITHLEGNTEENSMNSWTSIPVLRLGPNEKERSAGLAERLHQKVVGQDQAVGAVAKAVLRSRAWLGGPQGPTNSFLFLGPTGVGKTELAKALTEQLFGDENLLIRIKALTEQLFGDENLLIRINMSEYAEQHSVSRLIGSPPGYDGHEVVGQLTEAVRGRPYSVVVLEWVEKAHIAVMNVLLKVLDEGRLTDGQGRTVNFRNTIIMTSNLGAKHLLSGLMGECTRQVAHDQVMQEVRRHFRPGLLSLIDEIVVFDPLTHEQLRKVARLQMKDVARRLAKKGVALAVSDAALDFALAESCDLVNGARPIRRLLESKFVTKLSEMLLMEEIDEYSTVYIDAGSNGQDLAYHVEKNGGFANAITWQKSDEDGRNRR